jgi:hypothetical protein
MDEEMVLAKRSAHSVAEAKRRSNIKNGFHELQQIVPNCKKGESQGRFSKALILKKVRGFESTAWQKASRVVSFSFLFFCSCLVCTQGVIIMQQCSFACQ